MFRNLLLKLHAHATAFLREIRADPEARQLVGIILFLMSGSMFTFSSISWAGDGAPITAGSLASIVTVFVSAATAVYAFAIVRGQVADHDRRLDCLDGGRDPRNGIPVRLGRIETLLEERLPPAAGHRED